MFKIKIKENMEYLTSLFLSIFAALLIGAIIMVFNGQNPIVGYGALVAGAFGSKYKIATTFAKTVPLILTGLATAISFMSGIFNIGGEGQLYLGAFAAAYVGFTFGSLPVFVAIILAIMASALVGGLYAYFPGVLKVKYNIDEVITTIMLNSVAILFTNYLVNYPFAASQGKMGGTDMISEAFKFTKLVRLSKLNTSIFYTALIAIFMYYLIKKTSFGYNFKMVGENSIFAKYAGVNNKKYMIRAMIISGALCGIAGAFEVYGVHYRFLQNISKGYAFDGMLIALIVRNNPVGIVLMSIFFAMLKTGSNSMEIATGIPSELILVIQSIIILFIAGENGFKNIIKKRKLNKGKLVK
ncbi:ABC transporter permease [Anaeromicrobium sediminis]|uniref:ABC transporter permease n=1 Tax=Anaeromicrobium sediminis TaxID=1478221 RepID=A0A267MGU6_9FIRM|nr:ABC transporter permease [Anaeromicrobium sediminis]PAB58687.1 ABC transporter permease [Anaeromicrobium sediminis]